MGFFSWDCKVCGHPMLSVYALEDKNAWMNDVVMLTNENMLAGSYDGYGRVGNGEDLTEYDADRECYHKLCWEKVGKPTKFTEASKYSDDQGYFFDDGIHNIPEPECNHND